MGPKKIIIRNGKIADILPILSIVRVSFPRWYTRIPYLFYKMIVSEIDSEVTGFVIIPIKKNKGEVGLVAVKDKFRNIKIGSRLLEEAVGYLKKKGIPYCIAKVRIDNKEGFNLFIRSGFKKKELRHRSLLGNVYLMERRTED